ncbi:DNA-protecting protein DprA [Wenzhouxiangella sp. AB-CW3]|uniref:DNA-processing protein DprA n=1 Tax=Wenzhouxiangella sp. AB-CW3 TaxID=2771012 RepID=UPI00168BCCBE|nr:DNA-processing protein DprA [Wenzhouxiangella sp. AB-CW3]QOC22295.1 DNA-protecting protein DprA [Wenzhouxiangella sp. AB-CW3]
MPTVPHAEAWLGLVLTRGLGPRRLAALESALGSLAGWAEASDRQLSDIGLEQALIRRLRQPDPDQLARCRAWLDHEHHHLVTRDDPLFPPLLKRTADAPAALFALGDPHCLVHPQIAIVGSRNASPGGRDHARSFSGTLSRSGFVITSGLAAGIDGHAHAGCLDAGGKTIAVAGTGLDQVYPARHRELAHRIVDSGVVISQFPPGIGPLPGNFPARNRIISGMSLGTLVVEAGLKSGSLITARLASEQGRDVFAIPGSVHNPLARGCHRLIRDGAKLVESAEEIVDELAPLARQLAEDIEHLLAPAAGGMTAAPLEECVQAPHIGEDPEYQRLLEAIGFEPTPVDEIIQRSNLTPAAVSSMLLMLELDGRICAHAGGRYSRNA